MSKGRVDRQPAFVLHAYPYRETSLIVEAFSRDHGRVAMVARGARRPRSVLRGALLAFAPLELCWFGVGELRTLARAEWLGGQPLLAGQSLLCGYYLNELLMRLLPREDAHAALFEHYRSALQALAAGAPAEPLLRRFELALLRELGFGLRLSAAADTGLPFEAERQYAYVIERGAVSGPADPAAPRLSGAELLDLAQGRLEDPRTLAAAKTLMRYLIDHHLSGAPLHSRRVFRELQEL